MQKNDFILSSILVKMQEKKLLTTNKLLRLLETESSKEILKILNDTDYSNSMIGITNEEEYEKILSSEMKKAFIFARELSKKEQSVVDILALKYEYQNLKLKFKNTYSNSNLESLILDTKFIEDETFLTNYNIIKKENDMLKLSFLIDKMYLSHIFDLSKKLNLTIFLNYSKTIIDEYNIVSFLRMKRMNKNIDFLDDILVDNGSFSKEELIKFYETNTYLNEFRKKYESKAWILFEKDNNIAEIEKMFEDKIINDIKEYRHINIGPEPIFTYLIAKEYEIKALRLIISSKINKIDKEIVKNRLRGLYV